MRIDTAKRVPRPLDKNRLKPWRRSRAEAGAIAVMAAVVVIIMVAMFGFALDLSRTYNRKVELQSVADAAALAAANALDGTSGGIDKAVTAAQATASTFSFSYNHGIVEWSPAALTFATSADGAGTGGWMDSGSAKALAGRVFFARVDTSLLAAGHGRVENVLIPILPSGPATTNVSAVSVAGRDSINVLPLGICANSNTPASSLAPGELVEYGFRRGISYDLMNLPGSPPARNFLINPIAPAGTSGASMLGNLSIVAAYLCSGKMAIPALQGGQITVESPFPIASLYQQLNTRFGTYASPCQATSAPTDPNITSFPAGASWIQAQPTGLSVGPLWSYAKAAKYASYTANNGVEPVGGYTTYTTTDWTTLYPGPPAAKSQNYPATTPYQNTGGTSAYKTLYNTRVLHVPLLQCPVPTGSKVAATVLGIGKFFMTVPATSSYLYAEFAGMDSWSATGGNARLYR